MSRHVAPAPSSSLTQPRQFPVPPGILVDGTNDVALSIWALNGTASIGEIKLTVNSIVTTSLKMDKLSPNNPVWKKRDAY